MCAENRKKERIQNTFFFFFPPRRDSPCVPERIRRQRWSCTDRDCSDGASAGGRVRRRLRWHVPLPPTPVGRQSVRFSLTLSFSLSLQVFLHTRATTFFIIIIFPQVGRRIIIIIFYCNHERVRPRTRTSRPYNIIYPYTEISRHRCGRQWCVLLFLYFFFSNIIFPYGKTYAAAAAIYR